MRAVWKFRLPGALDHERFTPMPVGARVVGAGYQDGRWQCWAIVEGVVDEMELRELRVFATGEDIPDGFEHRHTWLEDDGRYVWHLFERTAP